MKEGGCEGVCEGRGERGEGDRDERLTCGGLL